MSEMSKSHLIFDLVVDERRCWSWGNDRGSHVYLLQEAFFFGLVCSVGNKI